MDDLTLTLATPEATRALGTALARLYGGAGSVLALEGPLGAGKTSLAKAYIAAATGIPEDDVTSPTFVLANEYPGSPGVIHLDAYRLSSPGDLTDLGFQLEEGPRAVVIEWGSRVAAAMPRERLEVELSHAPDGRHAVIRAMGARATSALAALAKEPPLTRIKLAVSGATGRMGRAVIALAQEPASGFEVVQSIGRVPSAGISGSLAAGADVVIDFSNPAGLAQRAREAADLGIPLVGCATGLTEKEHAALDVATARIPVLYAANTSVGVTLLTKLVGEVARALGPDYDIEIVELHHRHKLDAPSGTALLLASALAEAEKAERRLVHGRSGKGARTSGEVGVHALRLGDVVGEHRVYFAGPGERVELAHVATTRDTFARGALRAARWLVGRAPGRYRMADVLKADAR
jgi:4-hydroxy-tetrahydrodipicolinate reductase